MSDSKRTDPPAIRAARRLGDGPKLIVHPPRPGFHHPAGKAEILKTLRLIGPLAIYGVARIELARRPAGCAAADLTFGSYRVPGTIVLYEQP